MVLYKCLYCVKTFYHKTFYKKHEEYCLKKFNSTIEKYKLFDKIKLISEFINFNNKNKSKTFNCEDCDKIYTSSNGLKKHKLKLCPKRLINISPEPINTEAVNPINMEPIKPAINTREEKEPIKVKYKKQPIPINLKKTVWNKWIGEEIGKTNCMCCKVTSITQLSFHCGHVVAEAKGGKLHVDNLRPICGQCNSSMGTTNMNEYIEKYGFGQLV